MQTHFKNIKTKSTHSEHGSNAINKHTKFDNLTFVAALDNAEMNCSLGGNTFTETERVLTFDKGYGN